MIMVRPGTTHTRLNAHMHKRWYRELLAYVVRKIRPRSIYSKIVKGVTRKELQLDQLRRHSIRNYIVTTRTSDGQQCLSLQLAWPCKSKGEEEDEEVVYIVHLKVCACHCSIDGKNGEKTQLINELERCSFIHLQCLKRSRRCNVY